MKNPIIECACGCGETFKKFDKYHRERRYFRGHQVRGHGSKARKPSEVNPLIQCKCGCGTTFLKFDKAGRPREYCVGHNRISKNIEVTFWKNVKKTNGCWIWLGSKTGQGYGDFGYRGKHYYAHRVSWEIHNERIVNGLNVLHECDNPSCVNPEHLFLGTHTDNMHDAFNKNRMRNHPVTGRFMSLESPQG